MSIVGLPKEMHAKISSFLDIDDSNTLRRADYRLRKDINYKINMVQYLIQKMDEANNASSFKKRSKIIFKMYNMLIENEKKHPHNNDRLFNNTNFRKVLVEKLDELYNNENNEPYVHWIPEMKIKLGEVLRNRGYV